MKSKGINGAALRIIAMLTMLIDHIGWFFLKDPMLLTWNRFSIQRLPTIPVCRREIQAIFAFLWDKGFMEKRIILIQIQL